MTTDNALKASSDAVDCGCCDAATSAATDSERHDHSRCNHTPDTAHSGHDCCHAAAAATG